jgi:hydrogenase-4 component F
VVDPLLFTLAAPILAMIGLALLRSSQMRRWAEIGAAVVVAVISVLAPAAVEVPVSDAEVLIALLVAAGALAGAVADTGRVRTRRIARTIRLAGLLAALLPVHPLIVWLAVVIASSAGAAIRFPRIRAVLRHALAVNAALGLALFGVVAVQGGALPVGVAALLLGWGALVVLEPALLAPVLLLVLRLRDVLPSGGVLNEAMVFGGAVAVVVAAVAHLVRPGSVRRSALPALAQGAIAVCALGLGGVELRFAALLHLTLLTLCDCALRVSSGTGLDRVASAVSLSGLPPFGVFPSLALILFGVAIRMPWLLVPIMAGLIALGWAAAARLPAAIGPLQRSPAWVPLVLALLLGIAMPAPLAAWFQTLAKAAP